MSLRQWHRNVRLRLEAARREPMAEPQSDVPASRPSGVCVVCGDFLDNHKFRLTDYWRGKSDPYGNIVFDDHNPLAPIERPHPNVEPEVDQGVDNA